MKHDCLSKIILTVIAFMAFATAWGYDLNHQINLLDRSLKESQKYVSTRERRLESMKAKLRSTSDAAAQLKLTYNIYMDYSAFQSDSAIAYLDRCVSLSMFIGDETFAESCRTLKATQFSISGYYPEAQATLANINRKHLDKVGWQNYYYAWNHVYGEIASYSSNKHLREEFYGRADKYRDSIFIVYPAMSITSLIKREAQYSSGKEFDRALHYNDLLLGRVKKGSHDYAIATYFRYVELIGMGREKEAVYWLTESAIADVRNAVTNQASLWILANILDKAGDTDRSHRYIDYAWKYAGMFGGRVRSWQISPILSNIDRNFQQKGARTNKLLLVLVVMVSLLLIVLVATLFYMARQHRRLATANHRLDNINLVKEAYIGRFFTICSLYIDKIEKLKLAVHKMMKNRQYDKVMDLTGTAGMKNGELDVLYDHFDEVFLHLFPNFVEQINLLLRPDARFVLSDPKRLTTPIRIFALIRLGIDDSTKIAECLHYSVNTIYNYRAKVRNGALGVRDDFEKKVKMIGRA